ncbi:MAG: 30S ribosomal protein S7 [Candidatus Margulisiibacteriota bacterium]|nr:MAG: 30S ribosomal protein S7 [Candidatus Margulisbacteria bacterium GWD2_39_127]OGI04645.1 MAG: 30S ribosomal protein S7 [Candidatus Margulisbacteria bacterium GWF2_38_17]OGI11823.1 MAG: 30S ribosomal protein S7 [Candidatus Margulisbacteria bacterium GWE2_39_32]PZM79805.1 MAG: 30S ribosomal protein S7 [Candidatus Margulisiibacteriota bacterium]HAR62712.1 30S ribosomal protein S7 [Candidatus Margulisiibacteriota bacterium]
MPRRSRTLKRNVVIDTKFNSTLVGQLINRVMWDGKKDIAEKIVYGTFDELSAKLGKPSIDIFEEALKNIAPIMEVKSRRVGGSTYQVPVEVRKTRSISLALRWLVGNARKRSGKTMVDKLTAEILDSFNKTGASIKKREDTHKMAEANKAFAHFKW